MKISARAIFCTILTGINLRGVEGILRFLVVF